VSTLAGVLKPLMGFVEKLVKLGFRNIEIIDDWRHRLSDVKVEKLLALKDSWGLSFVVHAPFDGINISTPQFALRRTSLKLIKKSLYNAYRLDAKVLVLHSGFHSPIDFLKPDTTWRILIKVLKELDRVAGDLGVHVGIENMPANTFALLYTHQDALRVFKDLGSSDNIGLTLDVGHSNTISRCEVFKFMEELGDRIIHVHIHDNKGEEDEHLPLGEGCIEWRDVLKGLGELRLVGGLTVEATRLADALKSFKFLESLS